MGGRMASQPRKTPSILRHGGCQSGAQVTHTHQATLGVNLRRALRVDTWNILSLSEDHRLPHLSNELRRLRGGILGLSETRRPGSGEISSEEYIDYWSSTSNGTR